MDVEERVRRYAYEVAGGGTHGPVTSVLRLGGDRHAVFKVTFAAMSSRTQAVVVRVSTRSDAGEHEQVAREAAVLKALEGTAAPRLLDVCCDGRWFDTPAMCTEFVEGDHREFASATRPELMALGAVVGSVHARPVGDLAEHVRGPRTAAGYLDQWGKLIAGYLPRLRRPLPQQVGPGLEPALSSVARILSGPLRGGLSEAGERLVLLHGDVTPGNVLWAGHPVLIDWEYARLGDPADDAAYILGQHDLGVSQREAFWSGYRRWMEGQALDRIVERARWWEPVILLGSALWWLERWSARSDADELGGVDPTVPKPQGYYLEQAVRRLERFAAAAGRVPGGGGAG